MPKVLISFERLHLQQLGAEIEDDCRIIARYQLDRTPSSSKREKQKRRCCVLILSLRFASFLESGPAHHTSHAD